MKKRVITGALLIAVSLALVLLSDYIVFPISLSLLAIVAVYEILKVLQSKSKAALAIPAYILAAVFPTLAYFINKENALPFLLILSASMFVYMTWLMGVSVFSKGRISYTKIAEVFTGVLYITVSFTSLSMMRYINPALGVYMIVLVLAVAWLCDAFAYFVGSLIGKHKLIPEVSPKKTIEGAIGGVVFSMLLCLLYAFLLDKLTENIEVNYLVIAVSGVILSVVSQLGDLIASLIKREHGVKDYGKIFPGHGGVMDRFDSVLAVSTILMILCIVFPPFVPI